MPVRSWNWVQYASWNLCSKQQRFSVGLLRDWHQRGYVLIFIGRKILPSSSLLAVSVMWSLGYNSSHCRTSFRILSDPLIARIPSGLRTERMCWTPLDESEAFTSLLASEHKSISMKQPEDKSNPYHLLYKGGVGNMKVYSRIIIVVIIIVKILKFSKELLNQR